MASNDTNKVNDRDDRLKAALKANMAKRKAQAKARTNAQPDSDATGSDETGKE